MTELETAIARADKYKALFDDLVERRRGLVRRIRDLERAANEVPSDPDIRINGWRLLLDTYGGLFCAEPGCGCEAENSEIVNASYDENTVMLPDLFAAIAAHIRLRDTIKAEDDR